jgi:RNA polymerase sigma-70 factor (ECF subfamily)
LDDVIRTTDAELVQRVREGDRDAYGHLVRRYQGAVQGLAFSLAGSWADAEDIAQDTFVRAYLNLHQLREPERFGAWLRRITAGVALNWLRAFRPRLFQRMRGQVDIDHLKIPDASPSPAEIAERRDNAARVLRAVASLPSGYRVPLTLFHLSGLSYKQVADFLDVPLGTAKSLIFRAQEKLRAAMSGAPEQEVAPMVQHAFDEHRLGPDFATRVIEVAGRLQFGQGVDNQLMAVLAVILRTQGRQITYDQLMGVSAAAFRVHFWEQDWCPSSVNLFGGFDHAAPALRATGYTGQRYFCSRKDAEGVARIQAAVAESIDRGMPVIGESLEGSGRLAVIAGYADAGRKLLCRLWDEITEELTEAKHWPWSVYILRPGTDAPPWVGSVGESLRLAIELATTPAYERSGRQTSGFAAYEKWIEFLAGRVSGPNADPDRIAYEIHANAVIYHCLLDARGAASRYLRDSAGCLPGTACQRVLRAADHYDAVFLALQEHAPQVPSPWNPGSSTTPWTADCRRAQTETLRSAMSHERRAVEELQAALSV